MTYIDYIDVLSIFIYIYIQIYDAIHSSSLNYAI